MKSTWGDTDVFHFFITYFDTCFVRTLSIWQSTSSPLFVFVAPINLIITS